MEIVKEIVMKKLNEIKPYFRNPRKNDKTVDMLVRVIPKVGFNVPILIDSNGVIVKGHARYKAAFKLGLVEVPCVITNADEEQIKLDRITDNKISELSEWLDDGLSHEIDSLDLDFGDILSDLDLKNDVIENEYNEVELEEVNFDSPNINDEEKQKIYEEMLKKKEIEAMEKLQKQIEKAEVNQVKEMINKKKKYVKCVCGKCGEIFYVDLDKIAVVEM